MYSACQRLQWRTRYHQERSRSVTLTKGCFGFYSNDRSGNLLNTIIDWVIASLSTILTVVGIIVGSIIVLRVLHVIIHRAVNRVLEGRDEAPRDLAQKAHTLAGVIESGIRFTVLLIATLMILATLGISIGPLLASAGIAGLAIGLGAQSLIRDTINGFVIIAENQFAVGDFVVIGNVRGTVEDVNLRRTVLRAENGSAIIIPNSSVVIVENQSKDWSRAIIEINVAPDVEDDLMIATLRDVLANIREDEHLGPKITEAPVIVGLTAVTPNQLTYRVTIRTQPLAQWEVEREVYRRIRNRLIQEEIPLP